jgi:hypothetical protein
MRQLQIIRTKLSRQDEDSIRRALAELPRDGGHISVDVVDLNGEVGHACIFRNALGQLTARKGTSDPRNLFKQLRRDLVLSELRLAVRPD